MRTSRTQARKHQGRRPATRQQMARRGAGAVLVALALAASGCVDGGGEPGAGLSELDKTRIADEWIACMAEGGLTASIDFEGGVSISVSGGESLEEDLAVEAGCEPILSAVDSGLQLDPADEAELADAVLAVQKCLMDQGFEVTVEDDGLGFGVDVEEGDAGFDEAAYAEAEDACFREAAPDLYEKYGQE